MAKNMIFDNLETARHQVVKFVQGWPLTVVFFLNIYVLILYIVDTPKESDTHFLSYFDCNTCISFYYGVCFHNSHAQWQIHEKVVKIWSMLF